MKQCPFTLQTTQVTRKHAKERYETQICTHAFARERDQPPLRFRRSPELDPPLFILSTSLASSKAALGKLAAAHQVTIYIRRGLRLTASHLLYLGRHRSSSPVNVCSSRSQMNWHAGEVFRRFFLSLLAAIFLCACLPRRPGPQRFNSLADPLDFWDVATGSSSVFIQC